MRSRAAAGVISQDPDHLDFALGQQDLCASRVGESRALFIAASQQQKFRRQAM